MFINLQKKKKSERNRQKRCGERKEDEEAWRM
jgi:hypothetical protein